MIRIFSTLLLFFSASIAYSQNLKVYREVTDGTHSIYADNNDYHPTSVQFTFTLKNMKFSAAEDEIFVVPPKTVRFKIGEIKADVPNKAFSLNYKYKYKRGDLTLTSVDKSVQYDLPFATGKGFKIYQGYNGTLSHRNENALDFTMPEGTEIYAARDGIVVKVVVENNLSCPDRDCMKYNNEITIMHEDGTFASYVHLKQNGAVVKSGDAVKKGSLIGYSGNTGWSTGPHLHFVVYRETFEERKTIETKFRISNGVEALILQEGRTYSKDY